MGKAVSFWRLENKTKKSKNNKIYWPSSQGLLLFGAVFCCLSSAVVAQKAFEDQGGPVKKDSPSTILDAKESSKNISKDVNNSPLDHEDLQVSLNTSSTFSPDLFDDLFESDSSQSTGGATVDFAKENSSATRGLLKVENLQSTNEAKQSGLAKNGRYKKKETSASKDMGSNIRFLSLLPVDTVSNVPSVLEGLDKKNPKLVSEFANKRPSIIVLISTDQLNKLLLRGEVLRGLNQTTIDYMIMSEELAAKLEKLPKRTIAKMISANPTIAASFPTRKHFPARAMTERLLKDREFLEAIPIQIHAYLAETEFRHLITPQVITIILNAHPNLPYYLGPHGRKLIPKLVRTDGFLDQAPCATIINIAVDIDMINSFEGKDLTILASNKHVWRCLPIDVIRNLMRKASIGNKLVPSDIWEAVKAMTSAKGLDREVVINLLRYQFPDFAASNFG